MADCQLQWSLSSRPEIMCNTIRQTCMKSRGAMHKMGQNHAVHFCHGTK